MTSSTTLTDEGNALSIREHSLLMHSRFLSSLSTCQLPSLSFNLLHHNAHSLSPKLPQYESILTSLRYDVVSFSETWFRQHLPSHLVTIPNYTLFRQDRRDDRQGGGGAALYIRESYKTTHIPALSHALTACDSVWVKLTLQNRKPLIIASVYLPPLHKINLSSSMNLRKFSWTPPCIILT